MIPLCACSQIRFLLDGGTATIALGSSHAYCRKKRDRFQISHLRGGKPALWMGSKVCYLAIQQLRNVKWQWNVKEFEGMTEKEVEEFFLMRMLRITAKERTRALFGIMNSK